MDSGVAAILAGALGVAGTLATTWLNHRYTLSQKSASDEAAKALLKQLLEIERWRWRRLDTLANVIGLDEPATRRLLLEIGARGSMENGAFWGLISRNPLTVQDDDGSEMPVRDPSFPNPEITRS